MSVMFEAPGCAAAGQALQDRLNLGLERLANDIGKLLDHIDHHRRHNEATRDLAESLAAELERRARAVRDLIAEQESWADRVVAALAEIEGLEERTKAAIGASVPHPASTLIRVATEEDRDTASSSS